MPGGQMPYPNQVLDDHRFAPWLLEWRGLSDNFDHDREYSNPTSTTIG